MKSALLIVDVQIALLEQNPHDKTRFLGILQRLLDHAREKKIPVIHIQHNGPAGSELEPDTAGWEIYPSLAPREGEYLIRKQFNSAFKNTDLNRVLSDLKADTVILTGMQTEYCIDTTCRVAYEKGYRVIIPEGSNTTFNSDLLDSEIIVLHHNQSIFDGRFADVLDAESVMERYYSEDGESD